MMSEIKKVSIWGESDLEYMTFELLVIDIQEGTQQRLEELQVRGVPPLSPTRVLFASYKDSSHAQANCRDRN